MILFNLQLFLILLCSIRSILATDGNQEPDDNQEQYEYFDCSQDTYLDGNEETNPDDNQETNLGVNQEPDVDSYQEPDLSDEISELSGATTEDGRLDFINLAAKYGFPNCTEKNVVTDDGYILTLHHIPGDQRRPVLLAHGNTADSACWIDRGNISLAITLARRGYDVWAINFRGTTLSRRHLYLNADTQPQQFYNYSFYEQGHYDLPATIDLILKETKQTQLLAIGHSVGTTDFYVLGSTKPEYNAKIKAFISLAPICFLKNLRGIVDGLCKLGNIFTELADITNASELAGRDQLSSRVTRKVCLAPGGYELCKYKILFPTFGFDPPGFDREFSPTFFGHYPEGTSVKLFNHTLQVERRDKFANYDYGPEGNMVEYGSEEPPEFDLSKVTMKVALFVGPEDYLATVKDVERLSLALPNVVHHQVMPYKMFNHLDFVWGRFMPTNLYPYLLPVIEKYID